MRSHFRAVFPRAVALLYTVGTIFHAVRLIFGFQLRDFPYAMDWAVAVVGSLGAAGLVIYAREVVYRGAWERVVHWLIAIHLAASALFHVWILALRSHDALLVFPHGYSYFALAYFALFAWRSWTMRWRPRELAPAA